jgi:hypothetical protein
VPATTIFAAVRLDDCPEPVLKRVMPSSPRPNLRRVSIYLVKDLIEKIPESGGDGAVLEFRAPPKPSNANCVSASANQSLASIPKHIGKHHFSSERRKVKFACERVDLA